MKGKWQLFVAILQLIVGVMAIVCFAIVGWSDDNVLKWIGTLLLAVAFVVMGILGIIDYKSKQ